MVRQVFWCLHSYKVSLGVKMWEADLVPPFVTMINQPFRFSLHSRAMFFTTLAPFGGGTSLPAAQEKLAFSKDRIGSPTLM